MKNLFDLLGKPLGPELICVEWDISAVLTEGGYAIANDNWEWDRKLIAQMTQRLGKCEQLPDGQVKINFFAEPDDEFPWASLSILPIAMLPAEFLEWMRNDRPNDTYPPAAKEMSPEQREILSRVPSAYAYTIVRP